MIYLIIFALFLTRPLDEKVGAAILGAYVLAIASVGLVYFLAATHAADLESYFLFGRFQAPTRYQNANAALFSLATFPALFLAASRAIPIVLRGVALAAAGVLCELALLAQSRAWLVALPLAFVVYVALTPSRVRAVAYAVPLGVVVAVASPSLLHVYTALQSGRDAQSALASARTTILVSTAVLIAIGVAMALCDMFWWGGPVAARITRMAGLLFGVLACAAVIVGLVLIGNPINRAQHAWDDFKRPEADNTQTYFAQGFASGRYEIWRIALRQVERAPLVGVGVDNYQVDFDRDRHVVYEARYPHSILLRIVAQTGAVGALLFLGFLVTAAISVIRERPRTALAGGLYAAAIASFAYWLLHGSIDLFWEEPGLAAPAFAFLGMALGLNKPTAPAQNVRRVQSGARLSRLPTFVVTAAAAIVVVAAAASLAGPWLSAVESQAALREWRNAPGSAYQRFDRARRLNPLSDKPDLFAGAIAQHLHDWPRMHRAFSHAVGRNPNSWYGRLELGVAEAKLRHPAAALRQLRVAHALNPTETIITGVAAAVVERRTIFIRDLERDLLKRSRLQIAPGNTQTAPGNT